MNTSPKFTRLPEAMELADVGPYLASLQVHYKLSIADVSAHLHMRGRYIEAIETGAFDTLPGKVYARGYVQQYAEFLGIDPDQVVEKCFGPQPEKKDDFFVPEPARTSSGSARSWLLILAVGFCAYAIYDYVMLTEKQQRDSDVVASVPDHLQQQYRNLPFFAARPLRCVAGKSALACLPKNSAQPRRAFLERK